MTKNYHIFKVLAKIKRVPRKPRMKRFFKTSLYLLLIISWTLTGLPQIPFTNFPPEIPKALAAAPTVASVTGQTGEAVTALDVTNVPGGANQLYIATVALYTNGGSPGTSEVTSVSGGGLTWALSSGTVACTGRISQPRGEWWWAFGSPSAFTLTANFANATLAAGSHVAVFRIDGASNEAPSNPIYSNTNGQAAACSGGTDTASPTINVTVSNANSLILNQAYPRNASYGILTPDAEYTQDYEVLNISSGNASTIWAGHRTTSPAVGTETITHAIGSTRPWFMIAAEIKEAAQLPASLTQNDFEFWVDNDALTPTVVWGNPPIAENTALNAVPPSNDPIDPADEIRIRMNIAVTVATLAVSTEDFILQYKEAQDCTDAASWTDVDAAAGAGTWRYAASTVTDNTTLTTLLVATSDVAGRYNKSDPTTTNPNAVTAGQEFEWDWHVEYNGTAAAKTYCFRMVKSPVAALDAYNADSYPRIDTRPGAADLMRHGNFFTTGVKRGFFWAD